MKKLIIILSLITTSITAQTYVLRSKVKIDYNIRNTVNGRAYDTLVLVINNIGIVGYQTYSYKYFYYTKDFSSIVLDKDYYFTAAQIDSFNLALKPYYPAPTNSLVHDRQIQDYIGAKVKAVQTFTTTSFGDWEIIEH